MLERRQSSFPFQGSTLCEGGLHFACPPSHQSRLQAAGQNRGWKPPRWSQHSKAGPGWGTPRGSPLTAPGLEEMSGTELRSPVTVRVPVPPLWHKAASFVPAEDTDPLQPPLAAAGSGRYLGLLRVRPVAPLSCRPLRGTSLPVLPPSGRTKTAGTSSRQGWEP